jgi:hypothetical protein
MGQAILTTCFAHGRQTMDDAFGFSMDDEPPPETLDETIARLAKMPAQEYEKVRVSEAARLGFRRSVLDAMVAKERAAMAPTATYQTVDPRGRADLFVDSADLPDTAAELAHHLAARPMLFNRGCLVRLAPDAVRGGLISDPLTFHGVINEAHEVCRPYIIVVNDGVQQRQNVTLPELVAKLYLDARERWGLPPLDGIARTPLLHDDGTIRSVDGYDDETRLWCENVPAVDVPATPSKDDAAAALFRIRGAFRTFAFADSVRVSLKEFPVDVVDISRPPGADESAMLTGLLTAVCRPSLPLAPGLIVRSPQLSGAGTGKGLMVRAICAIAFGAQPKAMTAGANAEELEKRVAAALIGADFALFLDNLNGQALKSDTLASAMTERPAYVRPLGRSETVPLNSSAWIAATGNGLNLSEDIARRFLTAELDAKTEDPETRPFTGDFVADVMSHRASLLHDVLTIWRFGRLQGSALVSGGPLGSFPQWGRWCRDPLLALGCVDPAIRVATAKAHDPRRANLTALFGAWWRHHEDNPVTIAELHSDVRELADPANRGRQYLASRVRGLIGTRIAGFVLVKEATEGKWSADRYVLSLTGDDGAAGIGGHRGHWEGGGAETPTTPTTPYGSGPTVPGGGETGETEGEL